MKAAMDEHLRRPHGHGTVAVARDREAASVAADKCMVAAAVSGASLLAWWSVSFHPSNSRLWMVPVGLVLACTPAIVFLALSLSSVEPAGGAGSAKAAPFSAVVVEK